MRKTIGILGGMGPEATSYLYQLIIKNTSVSKDQDHITIVIYSNPKIPPRTDAILKKGQDPLPYLVEGVKILRRAGADLIVMPCVTAHYYYAEIVKKENIPFINLVDETLNHVQKNLPTLKRIGLIASSGTILSRLFQEPFEKQNLEIFVPLEKEQEEVMEAIFGEKGIKAGNTSGKPVKTIINTALKLVSRGAEAIIAGCTEVPLVLKQEDIPVPLIDPLTIIAQVSIIKAGYKLRELKSQSLC